MVVLCRATSSEPPLTDGMWFGIDITVLTGSYYTQTSLISKDDLKVSPSNTEIHMYHVCTCIYSVCCKAQTGTCESLWLSWALQLLIYMYIITTDIYKTVTSLRKRGFIKLAWKCIHCTNTYNFFPLLNTDVIGGPYLLPRRLPQSRDIVQSWTTFPATASFHRHSRHRFRTAST